MTCTAGVCAFARATKKAMAHTSANWKLALRARVVLIDLNVLMMPISFYLSDFTKSHDYLPDIEGDYNTSSARTCVHSSPEKSTVATERIYFTELKCL